MLGGLSPHAPPEYSFDTNFLPFFNIRKCSKLNLHLFFHSGENIYATNTIYLLTFDVIFKWPHNKKLHFGHIMGTTLDGAKIIRFPCFLSQKLIIFNCGFLLRDCGKLENSYILKQKK